MKKGKNNIETAKCRLGEILENIDFFEKHNKNVNTLLLKSLFCKSILSPLEIGYVADCYDEYLYLRKTFSRPADRVYLGVLQLTGTRKVP